MCPSEQRLLIGRRFPVELALGYIFLASQESSFISGETLGITGGTPLP
jgi:hypothetical protein